MIHGAKVKSLKINLDDRGYLMEIIRNDETFFTRFGQCYLTTCFPGIVKAWHLHEHQEDNICAVKGNVKLVLSDLREKSPTFTEINEFFIGEQNPCSSRYHRAYITDSLLSEVKQRFYSI